MKCSIAVTASLCLSMCCVSAYAAKPASGNNTGGQTYAARGANRVAGHRFGPHAVGGQSGGGVTPDDPANGQTQPEDSRADRRHRRGGPYRGYWGSELVVVPYVGETDAHYNRRLNLWQWQQYLASEAARRKQIADEQDAEEQEHQDALLANRKERGDQRTGT